MWNCIMGTVEKDESNENESGRKKENEIGKQLHLGGSCERHQHIIRDYTYFSDSSFGEWARARAHARYHSVCFVVIPNCPVFSLLSSFSRRLTFSSSRDLFRISYLFSCHDKHLFVVVVRSYLHFQWIASLHSYIQSLKLHRIASHRIYEQWMPDRSFCFCHIYV